jgi:hypothetical protein
LTRSGLALILCQQGGAGNSGEHSNAKGKRREKDTHGESSFGFISIAFIEFI